VLFGLKVLMFVVYDALNGEFRGEQLRLGEKRRSGLMRRERLGERRRSASCVCVCRNGEPLCMFVLELIFDVDIELPKGFVFVQRNGEQ
jgi:hypothetical protein